MSSKRGSKCPDCDGPHGRGYYLCPTPYKNHVEEPAVFDAPTYELGNGNYLRVDPTGGVTIYNDDNIVCLSDRQTIALTDALLDSQADGGVKS
jgi:hypothetical protein